MLIVTSRRLISALKYSACAVEILRTVVFLAESGVETALYDDIRDGLARTSSGTGAVATVGSDVVLALACKASPSGCASWCLRFLRASSACLEAIL